MIGKLWAFPLLLGFVIPWTFSIHWRELLLTRMSSDLAYHHKVNPFITFPLSMCADVMKTFVWLFLIFFDLWWTHQIVKRLRPTGSFERFLIHMVLLPIIAVTISFQSPLLGSRQKAENKVIRELSIRFGNIENSKEKFTTNILLFHLPWLRIKSYTPIFGQVEL